MTLANNSTEEDERKQNTTINNIFHKKSCNLGMTQVHVEPTTTPLVTRKYDGKSDTDFVKMKFCRDPMPSTSDRYEIRMYFFDNCNPEEFLLFMRNFNTNLVASRTLETGTKVQYLCTLVRRDTLHQIDSFYTGVEITEPLTTELTIKGLPLYFPTVNFLPKQKRAMLHGTSKQHCLKVRCYAARLIELNEYLDLFHGAKLSEKNDVTELNKIFLNSVPNC